MAVSVPAGFTLLPVIQPASNISWPIKYAVHSYEYWIGMRTSPQFSPCHSTLRHFSHAVLGVLANMDCSRDERDRDWTEFIKSMEHIVMKNKGFIRNCQFPQQKTSFLSQKNSDEI